MSPEGDASWIASADTLVPRGSDEVHGLHWQDE